MSLESSLVVTASLIEPVTAAGVAAAVLDEPLGAVAVVGHPADARRGRGARPTDVGRRTVASDAGLNCSRLSPPS